MPVARLDQNDICKSLCERENGSGQINCSFLYTFDKFLSGEMYTAPEHSLASKMILTVKRRSLKLIPAIVVASATPEIRLLPG